MEEENMPVYVKINDYKEVLEIIGIIKNKITQAKEILGKLNQLRNEEDAEIELWHSGLDEVERKVEFVDRALFKPANL